MEPEPAGLHVSWTIKGPETVTTCFAYWYDGFRFENTRSESSTNGVIKSGEFEAVAVIDGVTVPVGVTAIGNQDKLYVLVPEDAPMIEMK
jgi:hypothetical protein